MHGMDDDECHNEVNLSSGKGLVPSCNKPLLEPMLTQIYVGCHIASLDHNDFIYLVLIK